jgi:hypothetical protein
MRPLARISENAVEKVSYVKVPVAYPKIQAPPATPEDYSLIGVSQNDDNRTIVTEFRRRISALDPYERGSPKFHAQYIQLREAYDRIMANRMNEQGVPQPMTDVYSRYQSKTMLIKSFSNI